LEELVRQRCDGVAAGVFDPKFVPYINRAFRGGLPIITFNSEPSGLSSMVLQTTEQAVRLNDLSQRLASAMDQIGQSTLQIKAAMDQVSQGTVSESDQINQANASLDALVHQVDNVTRQANEGASTASGAAEASRVGTDAVDRTLASMTAIQTSVTETGRTVQKLESSSERIGVIVKLIGSVAYQIKLLGINAAIEAAHAGEFGAGFSVVAREIRTLAERSAEATREISEVVERVQRDIHEVLTVMGTGLEQVQSGAGLAEHARETLHKIRESVESNRERLTGVAGGVSEMQSLSHQVGKVMQELTAIAEETAASTEQVGAATSEMLAQLRDVGAMAQSLAQIARGTEQLIAKFTIAHAD
jgi:methyl-accepting chemotaxis protein